MAGLPSPPKREMKTVPAGAFMLWEVTYAAAQEIDAHARGSAKAALRGTGDRCAAAAGTSGFLFTERMRAALNEYNKRDGTKARDEISPLMEEMAVREIKTSPEARD